MRKEQWEFIDHTADIGLVAYGRDTADLFANAGVGLFDLIVGNALIAERLDHEISADGEDLQDLLVVWLTELLYLFEVQSLLFRRFSVRIDPSGRTLRATGFGERLDPSRHTVNAGVKAATRHRLAVESFPGAAERKWRAQVILDV